MFAGFDLGAKFGYAVLDLDGYRLESGTWILGKRDPSSLTSLHTYLQLFRTRHNITIVGYEKVNFFGGGTKAAHAYGGYEAVLWLIAHQYKWSLVQIPVQRIKKLATGDCKADKDQVGAAALTRWAHVTVDDNEADSLFVAEYARREFLGEL